MPSRSLAKYTAFLSVFTAGAVAALFLPSLPVRAALAALFFAVCGSLAGDAMLEGERRPWRTFLGTLSVAAFAMVVSSALYYVWRLDKLAVAFVILIVAASVWAVVALVRKRPRLFHAEVGAATPPPSFAAHPFRALVGAVAAIALLAATSFAFGVLKDAATSMSIRSPWDVVPRLFFIVFFLAAAAVLACALGGFGPRLSLAASGSLAFLAVSVAATVYAVGFGFDPFIHQATEATIFRDGLITPKPLYYVGQYAFVTVLARLLGGHVIGIDTWLVPVAFALVVPCAYWSLRKAFGFPASASAAAAACVLLLPLSSFAATTPQGLANAMFLMTAFLALPSVVAGAFPRPLLALLAVATATVHPLAGIPLVIFVTLAYLASGERMRGFSEAARWIVLGELALAGSVALPIVFIVNSMVSGIGVSIDTEAFRSPASILEDLQFAQVATRQFMAAFDLVYSWKAWRDLALIGAALAGVAVLWRRTKGGVVYLAAAAMFFINFALLRSVVRFPFLISYERSNYADRIFELMLFTLAPMAAAALAALFVRAARSFPALRLGLVLVLAAFMTSSLYLAYPRRDKYESSRGWSTSADDVEAVRIINKDAAGRPFIVLANQSVSAAAVREFGFKRYFRSQDPKRPGLLFYYPIPTGDALYQEFLDMNKAYGTYAAAEEAMDLAGVDTAYYVVDYYWWEAQRIILTAKKNADRTWNVNDKAYVFKYERR